jgi:hypothetical protein
MQLAVCLPERDQAAVGQADAAHGVIREVAEPGGDVRRGGERGRRERQLASERGRGEAYEVVGGPPPRRAVRDVRDVVPGLDEHREREQELLAGLLPLSEFIDHALVVGREPSEVQQLDEDRRVDDADRHLPARWNRSSAAPAWRARSASSRRCFM